MVQLNGPEGRLVKARAANVEEEDDDWTGRPTGVGGGGGGRGGGKKKGAGKKGRGRKQCSQVLSTVAGSRGRCTYRNPTGA